MSTKRTEKIKKEFRKKLKGITLDVESVTPFPENDKESSHKEVKNLIRRNVNQLPVLLDC